MTSMSRGNTNTILLAEEEADTMYTPGLSNIGDKENNNKLKFRIFFYQHIIFNVKNP